MAIIKMIEAVRLRPDGDPAAVRMGEADTALNTWLPGHPTERDVLSVVDAVMGGDSIWTRLASGAPGPKVKVVAAVVGHGVESIALDHDQYTWDDIAKF